MSLSKKIVQVVRYWPSICTAIYVFMFNNTKQMQVLLKFQFKFFFLLTKFYNKYLNKVKFVNLSIFKHLSSPGKKVSNSQYRDASRGLRNAGLKDRLLNTFQIYMDLHGFAMGRLLFVVYCLYYMSTTYHKRAVSLVVPPIYYEFCH